MMRRVAAVAVLVFAVLVVPFAAMAQAQSSSYETPSVGGSEITNSSNAAPASVQGVQGEQAQVEGEALARTGSNSTFPMVETALLLVGFGAVVVVAARRRRVRQSLA